MIKVILQAISGIIFPVIGIYIAFLYLQERGNGASPLMLAITAFLVILGGFFLFFAWKSYRQSKIVASPFLQPISGSGLGKTLEKNNAMDKEWSKTNEARDRLHTLSLAADSEK